VLERARHWSLSWARYIQSTPSHPINFESILIFSYPFVAIRLRLPNYLFPSGFPNKIL
jgi:hypothetical protein